MRRIYTVVQLYFAAIALTAIGSVVTNIEAIAGLGSLMTMAGGVLSIAGLFQLRHENAHFAKAVRAFWIYLGAIFGMVVAAVAVTVQMAQGEPSVLLSVVVLAIAIAVLVLALMLQYQTYAGFEELREVRGLDYPPRRILWCFYLAVISMVVSIVSVIGIAVILVNGIVGGDEALAGLLGTIDLASNVLLVIGVLIEAVHLWLMFTYMQAVRFAADNDMPERWE